jgi:putative ABC transport system permease protein
VIRLYAALTYGHFRRHRLEFLLCLAGVALGVAVVVAIDSAVAACVGSFRGAVQSLAERSTHSIFAVDGTIRDEQYIDLLNRRLPFPLAPMIDRRVEVSRGSVSSSAALHSLSPVLGGEGWGEGRNREVAESPKPTTTTEAIPVGSAPRTELRDHHALVRSADPTKSAASDTLLGPDASRPSPQPSPPSTGEREPDSRGIGEPVVARLIGLDVFAEKNLRSFTQLNSTLDESARRKFLTQPNQVVLVDALAKQLGAAVNDTIHLTVGAKRIDVRVCGVVQVTGVARAQLADLMIADLATAQELTDSLGVIDRIDTRLDNEDQERALEQALPPGLVLRSTGQQSTSLENLTQSYRMNLGALSLMASFVAIFIVYNSMLVSVQQRTKSLGVLRCVGATRWQLGGLYFVEAMIFASVGAVVGIAAGAGLSRAMVGYVGTTINDLYAAVRPGPVSLGADVIAKGLAISFFSCLVGAFVPLYQASRTPPVNAFRPTERHRAGGPMAIRLLVAGIALLIIALFVQGLPGDSPGLGFVMAVLISLGFTLACPWLTRIVCAAVESIARRFQLLPVQMAAAAVGRSLGITGVAVAATMLAMAMNISVRTMVFSFRTALSSWMQQRFSADVFVGPELLVKHRIDATIDPRVAKWISDQPETARVIRFRTQNIDVGGKSTVLVASDVRNAMRMLPMKSTPRKGEEFDPATDALISEPLAGRTKLTAADTLVLSSPSGPRSFHVYGIYFDFGTERGQVMLDTTVYANAWQDTKINSLHIIVKPGVNPDMLAAKWSTALRADFPVVVSSARTVKADVLAVFDRTFAVTEVLTWLAGGVAFCGLAGSLLAVALVRQRDYSVLAAIGMTGRQTIVWVLGQGMVIAWVAALVSCGAGTVLAFVLAYVIQYRSFGWSIPTSAQPRFWWQNLVLATIAAGVATIYPAMRLRHSPPAGGLRQE